MSGIINPPELSRNTTIGVVGLGYVGLPLAIEFGRKYRTTGFDISRKRTEELKSGNDSTGEVDATEFAKSEMLSYTNDVRELKGSDVFVIAVPTPIDSNNRPDLTAIKSASTAVGEILVKGAVVIFESTVFPGATEEICIPIIEKTAGMIVNEDFFAGYSPERINPGDKDHSLTNVIKVTSGSTPETLDFVDALYGSIVNAGTHPVSSIRIAEASKVIENTQRDVNIALINELALIFEKLDIDTQAVLEAAATKWNFLPFEPGLVGGHCIGVDPYYLTHRAQAAGYQPDIILEARRINNGMAAHIGERVVRLMIQKHIEIAGSRILVLGLSYKENCPDLRNTRVPDLVATMGAYGADVDVYDPCILADDAKKLFDIHPIQQPDVEAYNAIVIAVAHRQFQQFGVDTIKSFGKPNAVIFDVKHMLDPADVTGRL